MEYSNYSTEFIGSCRTQWVWVSHALSTLLYITPRGKTESPHLFPALHPTLLPFLSNKVCACRVFVLICSPTKQTEHDSQRINKVLMSLWALSGRSCKQGGTLFWFRNSFHIKYTERKKKQACVRSVHDPAIIPTHRKNSTFLYKQRRMSSSSLLLAVLLQEGHFYVWSWGIAVSSSLLPTRMSWTQFENVTPLR